MTEKQILLAVDFENAPTEVKAAAQAQIDAFLRMKKADAQFILWSKEREAAKRDYDKAVAHLDKELTTWDPDDLKSKKLIDAPETVGGV